MRSRSCAVFVALIMGIVLDTRASWVDLSLPTLGSSYAPFAMAHLPDGRFVYADSGQFYRQDSFGSASYSAFSGEPAVDPSFIAIRADGGQAVAGAGGFGASDLYTFDPNTPALSSFTSAGASFQNYQGVYRDAAGVYIGGLYAGFTHGVRYFALDGSVNQMLVTNVSTFSAGMAIDTAGNLYVGDTDNGEVRLFTSNQLAAAIGGLPLDMLDGALVYDFGGGGNVGSLAVDGVGRVWAAGYLHNGLRVYDPLLGTDVTVTPGLDNANYTVLSFTRNGESYVGYINQEDPSSGGSGMQYGYAPVGLAVPEPGTGLLALLGLFLVRRNIRRASIPR